PVEADYTQNAEYVKLKARHDEVTKKIESMKNTTDATEAFKEERKTLVAELDAVKSEIAKAAKNVEIEDRIAELQEEQREVGQKVADQEQMLYLLESFIKAKMERISDSINQHFKTVNFKMFETQINGGLKECCECTVNGVPYSTLNSGHRIVAGLDIIQSISELYGVTASIFVDNAESLNEYNVPDMEAQMILLAVSDDKELVVEGA
ncbi:MAG: recombinase RecF, partial [Acetatifactor sp.]|nr:recombinase RecF [Acetatifactor sp.]